MKKRITSNDSSKPIDIDKAVKRLKELEDGIQEGRVIEFSEKPDEVVVKSYSIKKDCAFCAFDTGNDHSPYCEFENEKRRYKGKPICHYVIDYDVVQFRDLTSQHCLQRAKLEAQKKELDYAYVCAMKAYLRECNDLTFKELYDSISLEEAQATCESLRKGHKNS